MAECAMNKRDVKGDDIRTKTEGNAALAYAYAL